MSKGSAIRLGLIGVGGFAGRHHGAALQLEDEGQSRVVATCDPSEKALAEAATEWNFEARGVREFPDYREMLDACHNELDLVVIPTPIPLHAEMHRACVERGLAVYLEKPPTLDPLELEEMVDMDQTASARTTVGFNLVADEMRRDLKCRLLAGEFGPLREVRFRGLAPRAVSYFQRAPWAARLHINGRRVLDSCFGNAMAHFVHNALLWSGTGSVESPAGLARVKAEVYRANDIEGADMFFVSAETDTGVRVRIGMTHACAGVTMQEERLECERATIFYRTGKEISIEWKDGRQENRTLPQSSTLLRQSHIACYQYLAGVRDRPLTLLEDCRPFVHLNALAYISAGRIVSVAETETESSCQAGPDGEMKFVSIPGIDALMQRFVESGEFPSQVGVRWAKPADRIVVPGDLDQLAALGF